jgi:hypothetical protein
MQRPHALLQDFNVDLPPDSKLGPTDPITIDLGDDAAGADTIDGASRQETDDGGVVIDLNPPKPQQTDPLNPAHFDANLAEVLSSSDRDAIAQELIEAIDQDVTSREPWSAMMAEGLKLMGTTIEKRTKPFLGASPVYDPIMSEAVIRFWAIFHGEVLPPKGPCKTELIGSELPENQDRAQRIQDWMNLYLTHLAPEYYPDMDQAAFWMALIGSIFKQIYQDPILRRPVAPFIMPQDLVVPYSTVSIGDAQRITRIRHMSRRDIRLRQLKGIWLDIELPEPTLQQSQDSLKQAIDVSQGITLPTQWRGDEIFDVYETEVNLDLGKHVSGRSDDFPIPYQVVIDKESQKCMAVYRNWRQGDEAFKNKTKIVHHKFLPGTGFYGFGYAHVLGNTALTGTSLTRQIIDSQTLSMFPGGLRVKGMRFDDNNKQIGPTEFREIDTGGMPIQQAVMVMPYKELSQVPLATLQHVIERGKAVASQTELSVGDGRQDAPVGTTLALLESANRITSASLQLFHKSFGEELQMIAELFGQHLPQTPYPFPVAGGKSAIMKSDFIPNVMVWPVSDPNVVTQAQRIIRAEAKLRLAMQNPQIHNLREAYKSVYKSMGMRDEEIALILPEPQQAQPADPLTENQAAIVGGPLKAAPWQDHEAHIQVHGALGEIPAMQAHIAEHMALQMRQQVERIIGQPLPPPGTQLPPQIENQIAVLTAKAMKQWKAEQGQEITPDMIVQAELANEAKKIAASIAAAKGKEEVASFKATLDFRAKMAKIRSDEKMNAMDAAANTADNKVPPVEYVRSILDLGRTAADIDHVNAKTHQIMNPPQDKESDSVETDAG